MTLNKGSRIENLQLAIQKAEEAFSNYHRLTSKREQLQEQIDALTQRLEELKRSQALIPSTALSSLLEKDKKLLTKLKGEKLAADACLDEIEEMETQDLPTLKNALADELCQLYPDRKARFKELENLIEQQKLKIFFLNKVKKHVSILNQLLCKIAESRKRFYAQGILAYIFGENPNVTISTQLKACELQGEELKDLLNDESTGDTFRDAAKKNLDLFIAECKKQWGFKRLDLSVLPFYEVFKTLESAIDAEVLQRVHELQKLESQLKKWLNEA